MQKGTRYLSLSARDVQKVQIARLKQRFELAEESVLAETVAGLTGQAMENNADGIERVRPGELVCENNGERFRLPLLCKEWAAKLNEGLSIKAVRRHIEKEQWQIFSSLYPEATLEDLWRLLAQKELINKHSPKGFEFLPEEPLDSEKLRVRPLDAAQQPVPPGVMVEPVQRLVDDYGRRPSEAESMVKVALEAYIQCCPRVSDLQQGQLVWLAYSTRRKRRHDANLLKPVVLTLIAPGDQEIGLVHRGHLKQLKMRQIERLTAEAWIQDAALTGLDLEWLLYISSPLIRQLLEAYHDTFGMILPTAGTVLDMGRTMTHKRVVIEMALSGMTTKEIARRIYHTEEAVDNYLKVFIRTLLLVYHEVPKAAMICVTGHSRLLIEEHLALAEEHFPSKESLEEYLGSQGISREELFA